MSITVVVDDADPGIHYIVPGQSNDIPSPSVTNTSLLEKAIGNTLHNMSDGAGQFSYHFTGTYVAIYAVLLPGPAPNETLSSFCSIDGNPSDPVEIQERVDISIVRICFQDGLSVSSVHELNFDYFSHENVIVLFDFIEYLPSATNSVQLYPYVSIEADDPTITYNGTWTTSDSNDGSLLTSILGLNSSVIYTFYGSAIVAVGGLINQVSSATGIYSIDSQPQLTFHIGQTTKDNRMDIVPHTLLIPGPFTSNTTTFINWGIQTFIVTNTTLSPSNRTTTTSTSPQIESATTTALNSPTSIEGSISAHKKNHTLVIAVPVVVALIIISALLVWKYFYMKRRHHMGQHSPSLLMESTPVPFQHTVVSAVTGAEIKTRRRPALRTNKPGNLSIPLLDSTSNGQSNAQQLEVPYTASLEQPDSDRANVSDPHRGVIRVQEEDSGIRGVEVPEIKEDQVVFVPPAYTES